MKSMFDDVDVFSDLDKALSLPIGTGRGFRALKTSSSGLSSWIAKGREACGVGIGGGAGQNVLDCGTCGGGGHAVE